MKKYLTSFMLLLSLLTLKAQQVELTVTLRDGDIISGTAQMKNIQLETQYGKLQIPIQDVNELEIGIAPDENNKNKYINLVKQMASGNEEMAQKSFEQLIESPVNAIPVLEAFAFSDEALTLEFLSGYSLYDAIAALKSKYGIADYSTEDIVSIKYLYKIGGTYRFKNIALKTQYGTLTIPKSKIVKIEVFYNDPSATNSTFKLVASKHISGNADGGWLRTGIYVKSGQKIAITASGTVTLASLSGNQYTPDGKVGNTYEESYEGSSNYPQYGNVVFRIGETGEIQKAGSHYNGVAKQSGMLYISIYETVYSPENKGYYVVKVAVK